MPDGAVERSAGTRAVDTEARRERFVDAAVDLVRREGPRVSMEQIAAACGVTKPIVYRLFGDRDELVMAMAARFVDELVDALALPLAGDAPPLEYLVTAMDAYLALVERDHDLYRFVSDHAGADRRDLLVALVAEQVAATVEAMLALRGLPTDAARTWAFALVGMVHVAGDQWISEVQAGADAPDRATVVARLAQLLWFGADGLGLGDAPARPPALLPDRPTNPDPEVSS